QTCLLSRQYGSLQRGRLDQPNHFPSHGLVHGNSSKGNTAWLTLIQQATMTAVARDRMFAAGIAYRQLAPAPATTQQTGQQGGTPVGRTRGANTFQFRGNHALDRLKFLPANIPLMRLWPQREPFRWRLPPAASTRRPAIVLRRYLRLPVGVGPSVGWMRQDT